jgi:phytoene dehydrogenase-like protein
MPAAIVVGSGPNGLAAAIELARHGVSVEVLEGGATPGGGCRTEELTLPGFRHDVCSTVQALATASPFFASIDLAARGVRLCVPEVAVAHPLDGGRAGAVVGSVDQTATALGADASRYRRMLAPLVADADRLLGHVLTVQRSIPVATRSVAQFSAVGVLPVSVVARGFSTPEARALLGGVAAHAMRPLTAPITTGFALALLVVAHTGGWPVVEGGSGRLTEALCDELERLGGTVRCNERVEDLGSLPPRAATLLDTSPDTLGSLATLPRRDASALARFAYGPGVCKVDWALSGPVPWTAEVCRRAGTVHVGGTFEEVAFAEREVDRGRHPAHPFCIVVQPCVMDPTRAPPGSHTLWAYCHVPNGSHVDMTAAIEQQVERFAPGFGDLVLARTTTMTTDLERTNPNHVGGDIGGGRATLRHALTGPTLRWNPYRTAVTGLYLCSSFTPPGAGVHGMCGVGAAAAVLRDLEITPRRSRRR